MSPQLFSLLLNTLFQCVIRYNQIEEVVLCKANLGGTPMIAV